MRKILKIVWDVFLYSGSLLAIGLVCTVAVTALLLGVRLTWDFAVIAYCVSLSPCLFGWYVNLKKDSLTNPDRSEYLNKQATYIPFLLLFLSVVAIIIIVFFRKYDILVFSAGLVMLSALYDLALKKLTRYIPGFKNYYISMLFTLLSVMMIVYYRTPINTSTFIVLGFIYIMIVVGTGFSDIKDEASDRKDGLRTFAVILDRKKLLMLYSILSMFASSLIVYGVRHDILPTFAIALTLTAVYNFILFYFSLKKKADMYFLTNVVCDAQLIFWLVFVVIGKLVLS